MTRRFRYLVTGREGQVVRSLIERGRLEKNTDIDLITVGRPAFDLAQTETIKSAVDEVRPDIIISAAAYTAVDQAESDEATARRVNAAGPRALAQAASVRGIPLIHLSTDYVFDGTKTAPYTEADPVAPLGAYGRSKLEGEEHILDTWHNAAILRTAWVYSPYGRNFVKTMLRVAETRDALNVVDDQIGNPTSALDIADGILAVAANLLSSPELGLRGVFHMTGYGDASWADFAEEIFDASKKAGGPVATVQRIVTADYPTPAKRPANSRLDNNKLQSTHGVKLPEWRVSAREIVTHLVKSRSYF
ncbi:dTDP-4-dehydrorhamnose reductase [Rhizobium pusense]|uniref:dTDP-4-dehydrorhamnose reductase n=1 Tax=Agrobacterium pusense TaxID=648995 RepID=UPI000D19B81A|nr:dTDP-4-dehydrorhamnose reductase [Agrobacterium pusense]MDH0910470.1 dTDP-4-dehydrorhamnose reductase [Agrobacterium pusense]MDH1098415.1 dTDP-4-dehydrorhamnose reductase [Agrobacterium pusense]MDH1114525.1 dTDP-4-dehydrorhamnose reductase [Agrobacterium pusense]MDH2195711.1 dTDP-4-dehydrorhamnose reductase [Agrobacterium pusense]